MNLLTQKALTTVTINGVEIPINSDFRVSIKFELLMLDDTLNNAEKLERALSLYYRVCPQDVSAAVESMHAFYCGNTKENPDESKSDVYTQNIYSFEHDSDRIYAAFLTQYGIDLQDIEYLHWWKFKALFNALSDDNLIVKIMGYRAIKIDSKMSKEQKQFYRDMKRQYALPSEQSENDKINSVEMALLHGGDLSGLV